MKFFKRFRKGGDKNKKSAYRKQLQSPTGLAPSTSDAAVPPPSSLNSASLYTTNTKQHGGGGGGEMMPAAAVAGINANGNRFTQTTERVPAGAGGTTTTAYGDVGGAVSPVPEENSNKIMLPVQSSAAGQKTSDEQEAEQATIDLTRNLVKKFIADIWNRGEIDLIPEVCSPSLRFNGNTGFDRVGHDGLARMVATIRDALDDYHCEIHSMVVEHNKAFCRLRFTGKHTGNLLGYTPTGKVVAWMGATEFTCQNGKILKVWELGDIKTLEEQLTPAAPGAEEPAATGM